MSSKLLKLAKKKERYNTVLDIDELLILAAKKQVNANQKAKKEYE